MKSHSGDGGDVYSKSQIPRQKRRKIFIFSVEKLWKVLAKLIAYCIFCNLWCRLQLLSLKAYDPGLYVLCRDWKNCNSGQHEFLLPSNKRYMGPPIQCPVRLSGWNTMDQWNNFWLYISTKRVGITREYQKGNIFFNNLVFVGLIIRLPFQFYQL